MIPSSLLLVFALQAATPAAAATPQTPAPAAKPAKGSPEEVVCSFESKTGSNFPVRVCHTRAEWNVINGATDGSTSLDRYRATTRVGGPH